METVAIIGCGYTGRRVAQRLLAAGVDVIATTRNPSALTDLATARILPFEAANPESLVQLQQVLPRNVRVLVSVPTLRGPQGLFEPTPELVQALADLPSRVVYLSTTGVYGDTSEVDESTPAAPVTERQRLRVAAEQAVARGPWSSLILRPAAIYGPGRGVHVRMREGRFNLVGDGSNYVSRIHVDDLAAHAEQALLSDLTGAYPVTDREPATSYDVAAFCAHLLNVPVPPSVAPDQVTETRRSNRRVDGSAIRRKLGITLLYPTYREGIPAALAQE